MMMFERLVCGLVGRRMLIGRSIRSSSSSSSGHQAFVGYLQKRIAMKGPLTVAEYMKECLANPKWVSCLLCAECCVLRQVELNLLFVKGVLYEEE